MYKFFLLSVVAAMINFIALINTSALANSDQLTFLKIEFHIKEDRRSDFMAIMKNINESMKDEKGFLWAKVYVHQDDPNRLTLIEKWQTRTLHEQHYRHIISNGSWASVLKMQAATPEMAYFSQLEGN